MQIIKSTEAIPIDHPVFLIFGQPGIGKTSLASSAKDPLLLDADSGAHRAANRCDSLRIDKWADVMELMDSPETLAPYSTIVPDTVGRILDLITVDIIAENAKLGKQGSLTLQGYGVLKARFRTWITQLRALGKDVLLIAHEKEEKDGDQLITRPDITGGSYGEVMKISDFVGFLYMNGRERLLDFSPTDRWIGKNPGQWKPYALPAVAKATHVMADLMLAGREVLGKISEASAKAAADVDAWRTRIDAFTEPKEFTSAVVEHLKLEPVVQAQVKALLWEGSKAKGFTYDTKAKAFVGPKKAEPEAVAF